MREISPDQATAAYAILVRDAGAPDNVRDREGFVYHVSTRCSEYRFQGHLGFGGKFRNNGNHHNIPHVDCYTEHMTPKREATIIVTNAALAELFGKDGE